MKNYLNDNTADVNYIKIFEQYIQFVTASTDGSDTEQVTDRNGSLLYWIDDDNKGTTLEKRIIQ